MSGSYQHYGVPLWVPRKFRYQPSPAPRARRGATRNSNHEQKRNKNHELEQQRNQDQADQQNEETPRHENKANRSQINDQQKQAIEQERSPNRAGILMPPGLRPHKADAARRARLHADGNACAVAGGVSSSVRYGQPLGSQ
jgi:membrane protein involved in colicin uptake